MKLRGKLGEVVRIVYAGDHDRIRRFIVEKSTPYCLCRFVPEDRLSQGEEWDAGVSLLDVVDEIGCQFFHVIICAVIVSAAREGRMPGYETRAK